MFKAILCNYSLEGKGPPLFLIHGIGSTLNAWYLLIPKLKKHFTVISYDLRGHGKSPKYKNKFDLIDLVEDLEYLRNKLEIKKAYFAGHSLGGMIVPAYAHKFPNNVLAIVLLSTAAGRTEEDKLNILNVIKLIEKKGIKNIIETLIDRWFTDDFIKLYPEIINKRIQQVIETDPKIFLNAFQIYANTEMSTWLKDVSVPSLVLTGENDKGCNPRLNKFIADQIPNSKLVILSKYKHSILLEAPEIVAENIIKFINETKD